MKPLARPSLPLVLRALAGAILLYGLHPGAAAVAQSNEFKLDDSGQWMQTDAPEPGTDEAVMADARRLLAEEKPGAAQKILDPWIEANERTDNPYLPEAYLLRGDALTAAGYEFQALYDYEAIAKGFASSGSYVKSVERELDIGVRYVNGLRRRFLGVRLLDSTDIGEELLIRVQERLPGSRLAERAGIELADYYFRERDMKLAVEAYGLFLENYPRSPYAPKAMQRRIYATIARFKGPRYNGAPLIDATVLVRRFAGLYPAQATASGLDEALLARLDESAGAQMLQTARWYLSQGDPVSARYILGRLLAEHPKTSAASTALQILVDRGWLNLERYMSPSGEAGDGAVAPDQASGPSVPTPADDAAGAHP